MPRVTGRVCLSVVLSAAHKDLLRRRLAGLGLEHAADDLFARASPCFEATSVTPGKGEVGSSRIGGDPDLPPTLAWPTADGEVLSFVAQVDLGALPAGWVDGLPTSGWLFFFVGSDLSATDLRHAVLHFDGPRDVLLPTPRPGAENEEGEYTACHAQLEPSVVLGEPSVDDEAEDDEELRDQLDELSPRRTQIGGLPVPWAGDLGELAHLTRTGRAALIGRLELDPGQLDRKIVDAWADGEVELATELELVRDDLLPAFRDNGLTEREAMKRWRVLFLLASEDDAGMVWSDAGLLHFVIDDDDLRAGRFHRTYCHLASV